MYAAAAASIALAGVVFFTVFDHTAQSQSASPPTAGRTGLATAAQAKIAFITAVPRAKLPTGYAWLAEVNVMNSAESGKGTLTRTAWNFLPPAWSPDGQTIGFVAGRGGNRDIYVVNADGSKQRNLTRDIDRQAFGIAWMPTARR